MSSTPVETATTDRCYVAINVRRVRLPTPPYTALIDPFRKLVAYPSLLRNVPSTRQQTVDQAFSPAGVSAMSISRRASSAYHRKRRRMSDDVFIQYLNAQGYAPIALPRERFDPLTVLGGLSPTTLEPYGTLADFLIPGAAVPAIDRDDAAPSFANRRGSAVDANAGVNLLGSLLKMFGGSAAAATAKYEQASSYQFLFLNVKHDSVSLLQLLASLQPSLVQTATVQSVEKVPYLYIVTETLKSNRFGVIAYDAKGVALKLDADAIQGVLDAQASVAVTAGANDVLTYSGPCDLRFAFRAKRLKLDTAPAGPIKLVIDDTTQLASRFRAGDAAMPPDAFDLPATGVPIDIADSRS